MTEHHPDDQPPARQPVSHDVTPASGTADRKASELQPEEEPRTTGTLFLVMIILMIIVAIWVIMYLRLIDR